MKTKNKHMAMLGYVPLAPDSSKKKCKLASGTVDMRDKSTV
jgi:hypothetical protein